MTVAVLIPFRPDGPERTANLSHVLEHWTGTGWHVSVADDGPRDEPWCKARAVSRAFAGTRKADVYVIADADVTVPLPAVRAAVDALDLEGHRWAMPHHLVRRLDQRSTQLTLQGKQAGGVSRSPYVGFEGGGMTVIDRDALVGCPLDPRFQGYGSEDLAWGIALNCLYGPPWRGEAQLVHLWHPDQPEKAAGHRKSPRPESKELLSRYRLCKASPDRMRSLLDELR